MKVREMRPIKLTGSWDASKGEVMESINQLQESVAFDLERIEQKIDQPTPSPEAAIGAVVGTVAAFAISPLLGVGLALMQYENILSAIGNHEECLKKSRVVRVAKALIEPAQPKNGITQDERVDQLVKVNQHMLKKMAEMQEALKTVKT